MHKRVGMYFSIWGTNIPEFKFMLNLTFKALSLNYLFILFNNASVIVYIRKNVLRIK